MSFSPAGGSRLVATCGGESLCVIDCEVGMVMKKYKVPGEVCLFVFFLVGVFFPCLKHLCEVGKQRIQGIVFHPIINLSILPLM